jgi:hypothetical protein
VQQKNYLVSVGEVLSVSAVRGVEPPRVLEAIESYFDSRSVSHSRRDDRTDEADVRVFESRGGWTTVLWPHYFLPRDVEAGLALSRTLHTVVSAMSSVEGEGWSHTLIGCGTVVDRFHSYPAALVWDGDDLRTLAEEWSGDPALVARVFGVPEARIRRHFCQACPDARDHPGRDPWGFIAFWAALGIAYPEGRVEPYAVLEVDRSWQRLSV